MKYLIYARKSSESEDKQVLSLDSQENELKRYAQLHGLEVIGILRESMSAKEPGRPVFRQLMEAIVSGRVDAILCWKIDRLTRNPVDGGQIQWLLQKGKIKCISTFEKNFYPTDNVLLMSIEQAMATQYIRDLSTNVKRGNREKLERGEWPNHAPLGYLNNKATKKIVVDTERSHYITRAFELYATGRYSYRSLADLLYKEGLRTLTGKKIMKSNLQYLLSRTFYTGVIVREGNIYEGIHTPLISKQLFDQVKTVMSGNGHPKPKRLFFPLRGFLKCASCGCALTASLKKGHRYYYCTNGKGHCDQHKSYMREEVAYELIANLFDSIAFTERKIELMYQAAKAELDRENGQNTRILNHLQKLLESLRAREERLLDTFLAGHVSQELYETKMVEIRHERIVLTKQLSEALQKEPAFALEPVKEIFLKGTRAKKEFIDANESKKRTIVEELLWNLSIENKIVAQVQYKSPYHILAKADKNASISTLLRD